MKKGKLYLLALVITTISLTFLTVHKMNDNSKSKTTQTEFKILFLHHSTGRVISHAGNGTNRIVRKIFNPKSYLSKWFSDYNQINGTNFIIEEQFFPKKEHYGWNNYPYDYYNIWVKNAGQQPYLNEPTLEILTQKYNMIIFKHCYPVSNIEEDINQPNINSAEKRLENYKLQYHALKQKMNEFPNTKFILWTGAVQVQPNITYEQAIRAKTFFDWVKNDWDTSNDNIFLWDFYTLETDGSLYLKNENATSSHDSHPGKSFAKKVAPLFCQRIIEVIEYGSRLSLGRSN